MSAPSSLLKRLIFVSVVVVVARGGMVNPGHLENLNPGTQAFFGKFKNAFEAGWRALGEDENSVRVSDSYGSTNRSASDYRYKSHLAQFREHQQETVEANVAAQL